MDYKPSYEDLEKRVRELEQELARNAGNATDTAPGNPDAEDPLKISFLEEKFKSLVENINEIVFVTDENATITYISPNILAFSGYTREEVIGRNFVEFVHPEDLTNRIDQFQKVMDGENLVTEYRMMDKNGAAIWIRANAKRMESESGFTGLQGILVDITDRKMMEEHLRSSEERYRNLFHNAQVGLVRTRIRDGKVLEANELCARMFQFTRDELLGLKAYAFYKNPDDRDLMRRKLLIDGFVDNYEVQMLRRDGSEFWASYSLRIYPENDCMEGAIIDVSQRKAAEDALIESEERFMSLIAQSPIAYEYYAMDGTLLENNPAHCRMWGVAREDAVGKYNIRKDPAVKANMRATNSVEKVFAGEIVQGAPILIQPAEGKLGAGKTLWLRTTMYPIKRHEEVVNVVVVQEDITDQKEMEAKLEKTHKQLVLAAREAGMAEVATGVLHNVGNILNSVHVTAGSLRDRMENSRVANFERVGAMLKEHIDGMDDYLTRDPKGKKLPAYLVELAEHVFRERQKMLKDAKQLSEHVEHMASIISLQQSFGKAAGLTEILDIREVVESAATIHKTAFIRHGIRTNYEYEDLPPVLADRNRIMQILVNLLSNAKHAIKSANISDGFVNISVKKDEEAKIIITVTDNGVGILPENLDKIFTHGFTTRKKGHGFGLHSGSLAASEMGGSLTVHSQGPGKGASFSLTIPYKPPGGHGQTSVLM
ncbi:MAG: PAS domain S-box protein [Desulfatibacillum sp.]|nr:PAS domain S-box protein [Desulfatibacillum sp.]